MHFALDGSCATKMEFKSVTERIRNASVATVMSAIVISIAVPFKEAVGLLINPMFSSLLFRGE
jgi:hypothetical protein